MRTKESSSAVAPFPSSDALSYKTALATLGLGLTADDVQRIAGVNASTAQRIVEAIARALDSDDV